MSCAPVARNLKRFMRGGIFVAAALTATTAHAQATTTYSYNNSNRLIQAISSAGSGIQYQYDTAGNLQAIDAISPQVLNSGATDTVTMGTPGEAQLLSFQINAGESATLAESALTTIPAGSAVTVNIYNSTGALVASFNTASSNSANLSTLPSGTYSAVVVPTAGVTGTLQLALESGNSGGGIDAPVPPWAMLAFCLALLGSTWRTNQRRRA